MDSLPFTFEYVLGLHKQIAVLETKLAETAKERELLEKAATYFMCRGYLNVVRPNHGHEVLQNGLAPSQSTSNEGSGEAPVDLLSLEDDCSFPSGSSSTAVDPQCVVSDGSKSEKCHGGLEVSKETLNNDNERARQDGLPLDASADSRLNPLQGIPKDKRLPEDEQQQLYTSGPRRAPSPLPADYFRWGIRYSPPAETANWRERVIMENLPVGVSLKSLMAHVMGGAVIECILVDTAVLTGDTWSALVRFREEAAARRFSECCQHFPPIVEGRKACVKWIQTQSYPLPLNMRQTVHDHGGTRCLRATNADNAAQRKSMQWYLQKVGLTAPDVLEDIHEHEDGTMDIRFASIWYARQAMQTLRRAANFRQVEYTEDPCSRPVP